jgi:hypothetical protein
VLAKNRLGTYPNGSIWVCFLFKRYPKSASIWVTSGPSALGRHILALLETYQMTTGLCGNPLTNIVHQCYLDSPWIETLREFLQSIQASIRIPSLATIDPLRISDQCIMIKALKSKQLTNPELCMVNRCRMFLQINYLSEITTSDGKSLLKCAYRGDTNEVQQPNLWQHSRSNIIWPYQPNPGRIAWRAWQKCMRAFTNDRSLTLQNPLGPWLPTFATQRNWQYTMYNDIILHKHPDGYKIFAKSANSSRREQSYNYIGNRTVHDIDIARASPVTPDSINDVELTVLGQLYNPGIFTKVTNEGAFPFQGDDITQEQNALDLVLQAKSIIIASDGGKDGEHTTYGWIIAADDHIVYEGYDSVPKAQTTSSFRGEAYGALAVTSCLLQAFRDNHVPFPDKPIELWLDNKSLIDRLRYRSTTTASASLRSETEVVNSIISNIKWMPPISIDHVKSHQTGPDISLAAIFNNRSDELATLAKEQCSIPVTSPIYIQSTATLFINNVEVAARIQDCLRKAAYSPDRH